MYWTLELVNHLEDAPWPATKDELIEFSIRTGAPAEVTENLQELEDDGAPYESIEEIWPDYPTKDDFFFNVLIIFIILARYNAISISPISINTE